MGCVSSKPDINDQHPNIFQVSNVNDQGDLVSPGKLEVTETELVLHQRGKQPTVWPLRSLRKYGFDSEIFSFECGRRCPTGEGIYAFRCHKAEQLFNMVQQHIVRNSNEDTILGDFPVPTMSTGPPVQRRPLSDGYLNPRPGLSRPGSIASNGPVSPTNISPPPIPENPPEHNNNKRDSVSEEPAAMYANVGIVTSPTLPTMETVDSPCHLYMNVETKEPDTKHDYANIDTKELDYLRTLETPSVPQTPTALNLSVHEVNYAELDLDRNETSTQITPESPAKEKKGYATIDFQKTTALSQSINPQMDVEEGSRKTRHNSTINEVPARHSNSLSD